MSKQEWLYFLSACIKIFSLMPLKMQIDLTVIFLKISLHLSVPLPLNLTLFVICNVYSAYYQHTQPTSNAPSQITILSKIELWISHVSSCLEDVMSFFFDFTGICSFKNNVSLMSFLQLMSCLLWWRMYVTRYFWQKFIAKWRRLTELLFHYNR